jgi:putative ABC transport system substrate-binding protein
MRALILSIALIILSALPAFAADVLILQASRNQAFAEAVAGFKESCTRSSRVVILSDYAEVDVARLVREERARLVLAVGDPAVVAARKAGRVPVVSLMALAPIGSRTSHVAAVAPVAAPEQYLRLMKEMGRKRIGIITDPAQTGTYLQQARQAASVMGLELVVHEARSPRELLNDLPQLKGKVDALWMLPDTSVVTSDTMDAMARFSLDERLPLVTFSDHYLAKGAAATLQTDRADMGRQSGELASAIIQGTATNGTIHYPRTAVRRLNDSVTSKLGITLMK